MTDWSDVRFQVERGDDSLVLELVRRLWGEVTDLLERRRDFMPVLAAACRRFPTVRAHFISMRDAQTPAFGARNGVSDWLALNEALDDSPRILEWFDQSRSAGHTPPPFSILEEAVLQRGRPADYLAWLPGGPEAALRESVRAYLWTLGTCRALGFDPEASLESLLEEIALVDREPRTKDERVLVSGLLRQLAMTIAAFEAVEPGNVSMRKLACDLLGAEFMSAALFSWEDRQTH